MVDGFEEAREDLSKMSSEKELNLSKFVEVTEEGTEAAADTSTFSLTRYTHTPGFCTKYRFLFFIQHSKMNGILFFGQLSTP
jgi:serpin B